MTKREAILVFIICLLALIILVGLVPVIIGLSTIRNRGQQPATIDSQTASPAHQLNPPNIKQRELLLLVSGKIALLKESAVSYVVLTSAEGNGYILIGPKIEELRAVPEGAEITIIGAPQPALLQKIQGQEIKRTIRVKSFRAKNEE